MNENMPDQQKFLSCVRCSGMLVRKEGEMECPTCSERYPVHDGIPFFCKGDYYFSEIAEREVDELLTIARTEGWKKALHDYLRVKDVNTYKIACDESRLDWRFLFPLSQESTALDMGCGWGGISLALAQRAGKVVAMDISLKRLSVLNARITQDGIRNIVPVCGGDSIILPFADKTFDLIVLNGVLEWLGLSNPEMNPRDVQLAKLKEIRRILKDDGSVYIGIENRIGYVYFLGGTDHNKLRFTTLMPRFLADAYTRLRTGQPYRTYTYSPAGYRKLLGEAGFPDVEFYATIPSYRNVYFLAKTSDRAALDYFFAHLFQVYSFSRKIIRFFSRLLIKAGVFRHFIPEISMVAGKGKSS